MTCFSARIFKKVCLALVLVAALLCAWLSLSYGAEAETYSVDENAITVLLDYGAEPHYPVYHHEESDKYFKVTSYLVENKKTGSMFSLVTDGHVTAAVGTYQMSAHDNTTLCDSAGNPLTGDDFTGTVTVIVQKNVLPIVVSAASLSKTYGDEAAALSWDFKEEYDRDNTIEITFASNGFAASAAVGSYPVTVTGVTKGGAPTDLYDVRLYTEENSTQVAFNVNKKPVTFTLAEEKAVSFNSFLLADGESVCSIQQAGVNGETLTAYYRLKTPPEGLLTVGEKYDVEAYRYEVTAAQNTLSYDLDDVSNYAPSFVYTKDKVLAAQGTLTVYQDPSLVAERQNAPAYLFETFRFEYLDPIVSDYRDEIVLTVPYYGLEVTLRCSLEAPTGALQCGDYVLEYKTFGCAALSDVFFDGQIVLTVYKRTLVYDGADSAEVMSGNSFQKQVTLQYGALFCDFELTADLTDKTVGQEVKYSSFVSVNPNFTLDHSSAKVTLVKRSTGVSVESNGVTSVHYGDEYTLASVYLNYGKADAALLSEETVVYSYVASGSSKVNGGLPVEVGDYTVYCDLSSAIYSAPRLSVALTVEKRPVAGYYRITTATKVYGEFFDFGKNSQLIALYDYDEASGVPDRTSSIPITDGMIGGESLRSEGASASKKAGEYAFDCSGATAQKYRVAAAIVYDISANKEVTSFIVQKAAAPAAPTLTVTTQGRAICVQTAGQVKGEISVKADYSGAKTVTSLKGVLEFTELTYGETYYLRVRVEDSNNYNAASNWSEEVKTLPFAKPDVAVSELASESVLVTATMRNAVSGFSLQYRVGASGKWTDGEKVTGLSPDTQYVLYFRAKNAATTGEETSLSVRTLLAPVAKEQLQIELDREAGTLSVTSSVERLEYRLIAPTGEPLTEQWLPLGDFSELERDTTYLLQVRIAATGDGLASEIAEITIDTHKPKQPFSLSRFLSNWFLFFVGGGIVVAAAVLLPLLLKVKRKAEEQELGGK